MYTRSRVVGSGLGANQPSRSSWDPSARRQELGQLPGQRQGMEAASKDPSRESLGNREQRLVHTDTYTLIAPNESHRSQIQRIAKKELEDLEKWKEQNRAKPINLMPRRLGGSQSEAEVRQKQQHQLMQSKYQKKLKREESVRIKKEAEEAEIQKMKAIQREKSNKLEEKKRLEENLRRETFRDHQQYKTAEFLSQLQTELPNRSTYESTLYEPQSSTWSELLELKRRQQEEERSKAHQIEHRRVNNAFLDRLQGESQPGGLEQSGGYWSMNCSNSWGM